MDREEVLKRISIDSGCDLYGCVEELIDTLGEKSIEGKLWIVERHRIREYLPDE